jgi:hypothetical protein
MTIRVSEEPASSLVHYLVGCDETRFLQDYGAHAAALTRFSNDMALEAKRSRHHGPTVPNSYKPPKDLRQRSLLS